MHWLAHVAEIARFDLTLSIYLVVKLNALILQVDVSADFPYIAEGCATKFALNCFQSSS